jgi:hypothetical protein
MHWAQERLVAGRRPVKARCTAISSGVAVEMIEYNACVRGARARTSARVHKEGFAGVGV